nr:hypothetical protein [Actinomadura harenae]
MGRGRLDRARQARPASAAPGRRTRARCATHARADGVRAGRAACAGRAVRGREKGVLVTNHEVPNAVLITPLVNLIVARHRAG